MGRRVILGILPALYPLACGVFVAHGFANLEKVFSGLPARAPIAVAMVMGSHTQYFFLLALLTVPFLESDSGHRWTLAYLILGYLLLALNPFTFKLLSRFTTRDAVWRVLWCLPVAGVSAAACANTLQLIRHQGGRRGSWTIAIMLIPGLIYFALYSSLSPSNGVSYSLKPLKVSETDYPVAKAAIAEAPHSSSVLAPENIAVWIPTFVTRVPLVSVREIYDQEMGSHLAVDDGRMRRELREWVSGKQFSAADTQRLIEALPQYGTGLVVTPLQYEQRLAPALTQNHFSRSFEKNGYVFFLCAGIRRSGA
jgi:hypothetical protein